jgi:hypothetical protein
MSERTSDTTDMVLVLVLPTKEPRELSNEGGFMSDITWLGYKVSIQMGHFGIVVV